VLGYIIRQLCAHLAPLPALVWHWSKHAWASMHAMLASHACSSAQHACETQTSHALALGGTAHDGGVTFPHRPLHAPLQHSVADEHGAPSPRHEGIVPPQTPPLHTSVQHWDG
jgi:hypothetical protein